MRFLIRMCRMARNDRGGSLLELAFVTPFLMLLLLGIVDFGRAYYEAMEVAGAAHAAAEYGSQNPSDLAGIAEAARADAPDVSNLSVATPAYGCECSDGTSYSANCSAAPTCLNNVVYTVRVTVTANYSPWFRIPGVPTTLRITKSAAMRSGGS